MCKILLVTQLNLKHLKNVFLYEIGLIAIREMSPPFVLRFNAPVITAKNGEHDFTGGEYRSSEAIPS